MGALEFEPARDPGSTGSHAVEVDRLVGLVNRILKEREHLAGVFSGKDDRRILKDILRIGTSAGGARAKAVPAWNPKTNEFRSGQVEAETGFEHWLLKFDGVTGTQDKEISSPKGYGTIEYAYHLMATTAGIKMAPCRLHHEGERSHFMTKRFDRTVQGRKVHMQSLGAMAHFDYRLPGAHSYEQAFQVIRRLRLPREDMEQQVLRAFFNVMARNCDDHVKNIAFLMDRRGGWRLSPAFDVSYAWNPRGLWTSRHQMSLNGKRDDFVQADLLALAAAADVKKNRAKEMIAAVAEAVGAWPRFAEKAGVAQNRADAIGKYHRMSLK